MVEIKTGSTLLHFLTQRCTASAKREFEIVLAANDVAKQVAEILRQKDPTLIDKFKGLVPEGYEKLKKAARWSIQTPTERNLDKILDMSPDEIKNLFKVLKSPSNEELLREATSPHKYEVELTSQSLVKPLTPEQIKNKVKKFAEKSTTVEVDYIPEKALLRYSGSDSSFDELLDLLQVKEESKKTFKEHKEFKFKYFKIKVALGPNHFYTKPNESWVNSKINKFKDDNPNIFKSKRPENYIKYGVDKIGLEGESVPVLEYAGPYDLLYDLLKVLGVKEDYISNIEHQNNEKSGTWYIALMPDLREDGEYIGAWREASDFKSLSDDEAWEKFKEKITEEVRTGGHGTAEWVDANGILKFTGTIANLSDFLSKPLGGDTIALRKVLTDFKDKQNKFKLENLKVQEPEQPQEEV